MNRFMNIRITYLKSMITIFFIWSPSISFADLTDDIDEISKPTKKAEDKKNGDQIEPIDDKKKFENPKSEIKPNTNTEKKGKTKKSKMGIYKEGQDNSKLPVKFESEGLRGTKEKGILS